MGLGVDHEVRGIPALVQEPQRRACFVADLDVLDLFDRDQTVKNLGPGVGNHRQQQRRILHGELLVIRLGHFAGFEFLFRRLGGLHLVHRGVEKVEFLAGGPDYGVHGIRRFVGVIVAGLPKTGRAVGLAREIGLETAMGRTLLAVDVQVRGDGAGEVKGSQRFVSVANRVQLGLGLGGDRDGGLGCRRLSCRLRRGPGGGRQRGKRGRG